MPALIGGFGENFSKHYKIKMKNNELAMKKLNPYFVSGFSYGECSFVFQSINQINTK